MGKEPKLFDLAERAADESRPGGKTWVFTGPENLTVKVSRMWDPALVMHSHDEEQINICLQGKVMFRVGEKAYELTKGTMIAIPSGEPHGLSAKLSDEDFVVIQLIVPKDASPKESERVKDTGHEGWPKL